MVNIQEIKKNHENRVKERETSLSNFGKSFHYYSNFYFLYYRILNEAEM